MTSAESELKAISAARLPVATRSLLADDVRDRHGLDARGTDADRLRRRFDPSTYRAAADQATVALRGARTRDGIGAGILEANRYLTLGTLGAAAILFPPVGVPAQLAMAATTVLLADSTSTAIQMFRERSTEEGNRLLASHLSQLRTNLGQDLSQLASLPVEEAKARLTKIRGGVFEAVDASGLDEEGRGIVAANLVQALERAMATRESLDELANKAQDVRIDEVVDTQRALIRFQEKAEGRLGAVKTGLQDMGDQFKELANSTSRTQKDVQFLNELAFGRMSAKEQIAALERGMMHQMEPSERTSLVKHLQITAKRDEIVKTAGDFLNGVDVLLTVAKGLKINPTFVGDVEKATKYAGAAVNTFSSLAAGNYLGAAGIVAGALFGGRGVDPAASRHRQIMSALGDLQRGQHRIREQLDAVLKNQHQMMENQRLIHQAILDLTRDVWKDHREIMRELGSLRDEVLINRVMLQDAHSEPVELIEQFLEKRAEWSGFDARRGEFHSYAHMAGHFKQNRTEFRGGATRLRTMIGQRRPVDPVFRLQTYVKEGQDSEPIWRAYSDTAELFRALVPEDRRASAVERLLLPSGTWREASRAAHLPERRATEAEAFLIDNLGLGICAERVCHIARICPPLAVYFDILGSLDDPGLPAIETLLATENLVHAGKRLLEGMLGVIRLAIAEASLMAGEGLLVPMHALVVSGLARKSPGNDDRWTRDERLAVDVLLGNPLLRTNWVRWMVRGGLEASGFDAFAYDGAVKTSLGFLKELLPGPWTFVARSNPPADEPSFDLLLPSSTGEDVPVALPGGEDVMRPEFARDLEMNSLMQARDEVLAALTGYTLTDRAHPRVAEVLKELCLWHRVA